MGFSLVAVSGHNSSVWCSGFSLWCLCVCVCVCVCVCAKSLVVSDSLQAYGLYATRLLCPWDFPGKYTGVGCHAPLQGIFPTQEQTCVSCDCCIAGGFFTPEPPGKPSHCGSFSHCRVQALGHVGYNRCASRVIVGSVVVAHGPSCSAACGTFLKQGSNLCPLHWQVHCYPLHHQGSPFLPLFIHTHTHPYIISFI